MSKTPAKSSPRKSAPPVPKKRVRRSTGRPKREDHKVGAETLILRTCELLRTRRPREVTIAAIARHAGVNPSLIRYYFGDRSSLILAAARHVFQETAPMREPITTRASAERAVRETIRSLIALHREYPAFRELFFEDIMSMPSEAARQLFAQSLADELARARSILALLRDQDPADIRLDDVEPALLHVALIGMGELYVSAFKLVETGVGDQLQRDRIDEQFVDFVSNMILNGLRGSAPSPRSRRQRSTKAPQ